MITNPCGRSQIDVEIEFASYDPSVTDRYQQLLVEISESPDGDQCKNLMYALEAAACRWIVGCLGAPLAIEIDVREKVFEEAWEKEME